MCEIQIIENTAIDQAKWDKLALGNDQKYPGSVLASYTYLNAIAGKWYGLVVEDYKSIMPLIYKKKWGISYLSSLPFVRQLGLIGHQVVPLQEIINKASELCKYGDLIFSASNQTLLSGNGAAFNNKGKACIMQRPNLVLPLNEPYDRIWTGYAAAMKWSVKKARKRELEFFMPGVTNENSRRLLDRSLLVKKVVEANRIFLKEKMGEAFDLGPALNALESLFMTDFGRQYFFPCAVLDAYGEIQMMDVYAIDSRRVYKMMSVLVNKGRELNAMAFGVDAFFQKYAGQSLEFDFMGSSIASVRKWVEDFGAMEQPYFIYRYNALPWPISLCKNIYS